MKEAYVKAIYMHVSGSMKKTKIEKLIFNQRLSDGFSVQKNLGTSLQDTVHNLKNI